MQTRMGERGRAAPGLFKGSAIADDGIKHNIVFRAAIFPRPGNREFRHYPGLLKLPLLEPAFGRLKLKARPSE